MKTKIFKAVYALFIVLALGVLLWFKNYEIITALKDITIIIVFVLWLLYQKDDNNDLQK